MPVVARLALTTALALTAVLSAVGPAGATPPAAPATQPAAAQPMLTDVYLGQVSPGGRTTVTVRVPQGGRYRVQWFVDAPETPSRLYTRVDGVGLPVVRVPAAPDAFGAFGYTVDIGLRAGSHTFRLAAPQLPNQASVSLVDARTQVQGH